MAQPNQFRRLVGKPYDYQQVDDEIWIFIFTNEGTTALVRVQNYPHTIYLDVPGTFTKTWVKKDFVPWLTRCLAENADGLEVSVVSRRTLYFYQAEERNMLELKLPTAEATKHCVNLFSKKERSIGKGTTIVTGQFVPYQRDINRIRQLLTEAGIEMCQELAFCGDERCSGGAVQTPEVLELEVNGKSICSGIMPARPEECGGKYNLTHCFFDIETDGRSGQPINMNIPDYQVMLVSFRILAYEGAEAWVGNVHQVNLPETHDKPQEWVQATDGTWLYRALNEREVIEVFLEKVRAHRAHVMVGWNSANFDLPYLVRRLSRLNIPVPDIGFARKAVQYNGVEGFAPVRARRISCTFGIDAYVLNTYGVIYLDLMHQAMRDMPKERSHKLGDIAKVTIGEAKDDMSYDRMFELFASQREDPLANLEEMGKVREYCDQDARLTDKLYHYFHTQHAVMEGASVSGIAPMEVNTHPVEGGLESILHQYATRRGIVMNMLDKSQLRVKQFLSTWTQGGFVMEPDKGEHLNAVCCDFNSLYPSLVMDHNICWTTMDIRPQLAKEGGYPISELCAYTSPIPEGAFTEYSFTQEEARFSKSVIAELEDSSEDEEVGEQLVDEARSTSTAKRLRTEEGLSVAKLRRQKTSQDYTYRVATKQHRLGLLPEIMHDLVARRAAARQLIKATTDRTMASILNQRQLALKASANAFYGFMAMGIIGRHSMPPASQLITALGRRDIVRMGKYMNEKHGCQWLYADTDSIFYTYPDKRLSTMEVRALAEQHAREMTATFASEDPLFPNVMNFELEKVMDFQAIKKKMYMYFVAEKDGTYSYTAENLNTKGVASGKRDTCAWMSTTYNTIAIQWFRSEPMEALFATLLTAVQRLRSATVPIEDLAVSYKMGQDYTNPSSMMCVFRDTYRILYGITLKPTRYSVVVIKDPGTKHVGARMRLMEHATVAELDKEYYLSSHFEQHIDRLWAALFRHVMPEVRIRTKPIRWGKTEVWIDTPGKLLRIWHTTGQDTSTENLRAWFERECAKLSTSRREYVA